MWTYDMGTMVLSFKAMRSVALRERLTICNFCSSNFLEKLNSKCVNTSVWLIPSHTPEASIFTEQNG